MNRRIVFVVAMFAVLAGIGWAGAMEDWPHWRGPGRNDISPETGLMQSWPEGGPEKLWTNGECGLGYAGVAVVDGKLFTLGTEENIGEFALCLDAQTGKQIWRTPIADFGRDRGRATSGWGDGSRSTPSVDGDHVYVMAASGVLSCLNTENGEVVWKQAMEDFGGSVPSWGYAESPLVDGDLVVCTPGGEQGAILALNKKTGEKVWQTGEVTDTAHYSSVLPMEVDGKKQYVQLLVSQVVGIDPSSGKLLWSVPWGGSVAVIPSPVNFDGDVYVTSGYKAGSMLVDAESNGAERDWYSIEMQNHHGGVVLVDGYVYGFTDYQRGAFACQEASTGKTQWRNKDLSKGAVAYADGRFYFIEESGGRACLIDASPEGMEIVGSFELQPQSDRRAARGRIWMHPVIADGKLYLRDQEFLSCYDIQAK